MRWLAARGGMLEGGTEGGDGGGGGVVGSWSREASAKEAEALTSDQFWFESRVPSLPWEVSFLRARRRRKEEGGREFAALGACVWVGCTM